MAKVFTLNDLNQYVQNFRYGYSELKDKPVCIANDDLTEPIKTLGQTAVQIWLLSRVFSFYVEPFSDEFPDAWKVLQTVLEISAICCPKKISIIYLFKAHLHQICDCICSCFKKL